MSKEDEINKLFDLIWKNGYLHGQIDTMRIVNKDMEKNLKKTEVSTKND